MTEAEILGKMIDRLQDKGWVQGIIWEEEFVPSGMLTFDGGFLIKRIPGRACLQGTAELCDAGPLTMVSAIGDRLAAAIADLFPERKEGQAHWDTVVKFNDHENTTFEDVMMIMKHARERADG